MTCPLCEAKRLTKWYYKDEICYVCDCLHCGVPMIVLKEHKRSPTVEEQAHMNSVVEELFGNVLIRRRPRRIRDHLHWHLINDEGI